MFGHMTALLGDPHCIQYTTAVNDCCKRLPASPNSERVMALGVSSLHDDGIWHFVIKFQQLYFATSCDKQKSYRIQVPDI